MYEDFYSLSDKPFQLSPDPAFYFDSKQHRRAMSYLEYGLHQNEGFIVITGEIGAGKTTLVRNLFNRIDPTKIVAAHLVSTQLNAEDTLRLVAAAFGVPASGMDKSDILLALEAHFVSTVLQGKRCLLVVDEAQNLTRNAIEELRMLSNFQLETQALLQSFLIGQPEFRQTLQRPDMEQLRQRVIASSHISPMSPAETQGYVEHRLARVGWRGDPKFTPAGFQAIFDASGGIPRRINSLCDRLLWHGYLEQMHLFDKKDVTEVAREMLAESGPAAKTRGDIAPAADEVTSQRPQLRSIATMPTEAALTTTSDAKSVHSLATIGSKLTKIEHAIDRLERNHVQMLKALQEIAQNATNRPTSTPNERIGG